MTSGIAVPSALSLDRLLRRLKPEKHANLLRRDDAKLAFADSEAKAGPALVLDTCVYLHVLKGKTPSTVDDLLSVRTMYHSATAIAELTNRFGSRIPANARERSAHEILKATINDIPDHRIVAPSAQIWAEAGVLAGICARVRGYRPPQSQDGLHDALILLQARDVGAAVLTANVEDFDILQQIVPNARVIFYREAP